MLLGLIAAMLITMVTLPPLIELSRQNKLLVYPEARKIHQSAMPQIGGLAIFLGFLLPSVLLLRETPDFWAYLLGASIVLLMGLYDDLRELDYRAKFFFQCVAALLVTVLVDTGGLALQLGDQTWPLSLAGAFVVFLTLVAVTNAVNLADGLDGLAAGLVLISATAVAVISFGSFQVLPFALTVTLVGGLFGFLRFNAHPARIFMGDCGAYFIGFTLAFAGLQLCRGENGFCVLALLLITGVPVYDTASVAIRRMLRGEHPFSPDRTHFHHRLLALELTHDQAVQMTYVVHTIMVAAGYLLAQSNEALVLLVYLGMVLVIEAAIAFFTSMRAESRSTSADRGTSQVSPTASTVTSTVTSVADTNPYQPFLVLLLPLLAYLTQRAPSVDFAVVAAVFFLGCLVLWRLQVVRGDAKRWHPFERAALYLYGAYAVYFMAAADDPMLRSVEELGFVFLALVVIFRAVVSHSERFNLTALDVLVLLVTIALSLLGEWQLDDRYGVQLIKLIVWFYAVEALVVSQPAHPLSRSLLLFGLLCLGARYLMP